MRLKGFLFGADALIVLALVSTLPLLSFSWAPSGALEKQAAGFDYLNSSVEAREWLSGNWVQHSFSGGCAVSGIAVRNYTYPGYAKNFALPDCSSYDFEEVCVS